MGKFAYCVPVAAFRNALKPLPDQPTVQDRGTDVTLVQGYAEAVVSATGVYGGTQYQNLLQYLCRDPRQPAVWRLQPFCGGGRLCNGAVVIARTNTAAPANVTCFWLDNHNSMYRTWMVGESAWNDGATPPPEPSGSAVPSAAEYDPAKWNTDLGYLHVAYTPAASGGGGREPVVYAAQSRTYLVTVDAIGDGWRTTVYAGLGDGLVYNDLTLVPTGPDAFVLFANVTGKHDLAMWTGTFGQSHSLVRSDDYKGNPSASGNGTLSQIITASISSAGTQCVFYTDSDGQLLMWPATRASCSPVPVAQAGTLLGAGALSGSGSRSNIYTVARDDSVWLAHQLMWTLGGQMPFMAPASRIAEPGPRRPVALGPVTAPRELAALFVVRTGGELSLFELSGDAGHLAHGAHQVTFGDGDWTGGPVAAQNGPITIDTKVY